MSVEKRNAIIEENGQSGFSVSIDVSGFQLLGDEPVDMGGGNLGPSPYDFLLCALGECTAMTVRWYARQQKWPLDKVVVHISHYKENKTDVFEKIVTLFGDQLTAEQRQKLVDVAGKCPVQRTMEGTPIIKTQAGE
jgi:putative redox protein